MWPDKKRASTLLAFSRPPACYGNKLGYHLAGLPLPAGDATEISPLPEGKRLAHGRDQDRAPRRPRLAG
jgi:hypothetical protein